MVEIFGFLQTFLSELKLKNAERHKNKQAKKQKQKPRNNNTKMHGIYIIYMFLNQQLSDCGCLHVTTES